MTMINLSSEANNLFILLLFFSFFIVLELWKIRYRKASKKILLTYLFFCFVVSVLFIFSAWQWHFMIFIPFFSVYFSIVLVSLYLLARHFGRKSLSVKFFTTIVIINVFCYLWFLPSYAGQRGESTVTKFRFQVYETDSHDYGESYLLESLFCFHWAQCGKYGTMAFYERVGGWQEYLGLKDFEHQSYEEYFGKEQEPSGLGRY